MTTDERLARLEKSLGQWRKASVALISLIVVVLFSGAVNTAPVELTVRRLTVVDENGKPCITLMRKSATDFTGIIMEQPNAGGESKGGSVALVTNKDGASLRLGFGSQDENKATVTMIVNRSEKTRLYFNDGKTEFQVP